MRHGDESPITLVEIADHADTACAEARGRSGNLFGPPDPNSVFQGYGRSPEDREKTRDLLSKLAVAMSKEGVRRDPATNDNHDIPAGYTYFGQLVAHDLTFHKTPTPRQPVTASDLENLRDKPMLLQCLYGSGPDEAPWLYRSPEDGHLPRSQLRLGATQPSRFDAEKHGRFEDIPRLSCALYDEKPTVPKCHDPLIADERNDDNLIISQLVVLFHKLHNKIFDLVKRSDLPPPPPDRHQRWLHERHRYELARRLAVLSYRSVVKSDFLDKLLDRRVYCDYRNKSSLDEFVTPPFKADAGAGCLVYDLPIEFSIAAFRVGHAMIQPDYEFNQFHSSDSPHTRERANLQDLLEFSGARNIDQVPITDDWVIDWARFFDINDSTPNPSRQLRPVFTRVLSRAGFGADDGREGGLIYKDLVRHLTHGVRNVATLIGEDGYDLGTRFDDEIYRNSGVRSEAIRQRLKEGTDRTSSDRPFSPDELRILSEDPPLLYFLLFEAERCHDGKRLGPLGSTIIAEIIFGAMVGTEDEIGTLPSGLEGNVFPDGRPKMMGDVVRFVEGPSPTTEQPVSTDPVSSGQATTARPHSIGAE